MSEAWLMAIEQGKDRARLEQVPTGISIDEMWKRAALAAGSYLTTHPDVDPIETLEDDVTREARVWASMRIIDPDEKPEYDTPERHKQQLQSDVLAGLRTPNGHYTERAWNSFLVRYALCGSIKRACMQSGVSRGAVHHRRNRDAEFAANMDEAAEMITDDLEGEAIERAMDSKRDDSDRMLQFLLKARRKEVYGDKIQVDSRSTRRNVNVEAKIDMRRLSDAQLDNLIDIQDAVLVEAEASPG